MATSLVGLTECMSKLRNHDPAVYEKFCRLFDAYVQDVVLELTMADSQDILVAQGRARQARKLFELLVTDVLR